MARGISQVKGWLGLGDESDVLPPRPVAASNGELRSVSRVSPMRSRRGVAEVNEIYTIEPRSYAEAPIVAANYRLGIPVIINMNQLSELDSRRMLDFLLGLKEGLEGHLKRVTPKVFLISPNHVLVNNEDDEAEPTDDLIFRP